MVTAVSSRCAILYSIMTRKPNGLLHQDLTGQILGAFYGVYNELGSGFPFGWHGIPHIPDMLPRSIGLSSEHVDELVG